jgi:hypothetical protein
MHVSDRVFAALGSIPAWPSKVSDLISSSSLSPCSVPLVPFPPLISHSCSHPHPFHSFLLPIPSPLVPPLLHRSLAPTMHHIVTWVGRRHKGNPQQNSVVPCATSASQPKGESGKTKDLEATGPCHVDLGSGHANPLNSTSRSNDGDVSTCIDDAITGRYLSRLAPPYNRQTVRILVPLMLISLSPTFQANIKVI